MLILDVREWEASAERKDREPLFRKSVDTDRGKLTFTSITELDRGNRQLLLSERHTLVHDGQERSSDYRFVMRCWTRDELESSLAQPDSVTLPSSVHTTPGLASDARIALSRWLDSRLRPNTLWTRSRLAIPAASGPGCV